MDKRTKNIILFIVILIAGAIALKIIFTYWWTFIIAAIAFGIGYFMGKYGKSKPKK